MHALKIFVTFVFIALISSAVLADVPVGYCKVVMCNKLERFTLSPWSIVKDKIGEQCFETMLELSDAVEGKILDSSTRWYHGSFNPTKRSVTRVKHVLACNRSATNEVK